MFKAGVLQELTPILLAAARRTMGVSSVHKHLNILRESFSRSAFRNPSIRTMVPNHGSYTSSDRWQPSFDVANHRSYTRAGVTIHGVFNINIHQKLEIEYIITIF